jgi:hypothetical protein
MFLPVRHNVPTSAELERITIDSGNAGKVFRFQANYGGVYRAINLINWRISTLSSMYSTSSIIDLRMNRNHIHGTET